MIMSLLGVPKKPLKPVQVKALSVCTVEERALLLKRIRQREWVAERRKANPEKYLQSVRAWRKKAVARGYYRVGGNGYRATPSSAKRRAYWVEYNRTRRVRA